MNDGGSLYSQIDKLEEVRALRRDVVEALIDQGFTRSQSENAAAAAAGESFSELFKSALTWLNAARASGRLPTERKSITMPEEHKTNGRAAERKCPGFKRECGAVIGEKKELCASCYSRRWYAQHRDAAKQPRKPAAANGNGHKVPKVAEIPISRVALEVTETQLNAFLVRLPLADKQRLANHYLETAEL